MGHGNSQSPGELALAATLRQRPAQCQNAAIEAGGTEHSIARPMVQRLNWLMTAIIYFGEISVASLLAVALLSISPHGVLSASALFIGGVVVWTLLEYLVHRFVLHDFFPVRHGMHHANPDEPVLTVFWQIWACFAVVYFVADGAFLAGALGAYAWYLFVHHSAHHGPNNLLLSLLKHHKTHHRLASRNFGVSTSLWDHVFRTMSHGCPNSPERDRPFPPLADKIALKKSFSPDERAADGFRSRQFEGVHRK
jgi:hypothetical protein